MPGAGTDKTKRWVQQPGPVVILVEPQLGENIGSAARAMANFGLSKLRLVKPREEWPNPQARKMASGADRILNDAVAAPNASGSHRETLRRYALHTELFADRGGAVAAGAVAPAISTLVKVQTGIGTVDAAAYLRQAMRDAGGPILGYCRSGMRAANLYAAASR